MPVVPFAEYRPDVSDYEGQTSKDITNVFPRGDGYGPIGNISTITGALPAACRGIFGARSSTGGVTLFAGTSTNLYVLNNTTGTWSNVSLSGGPYTTIAASSNWSFAQFNTYIIATHSNLTIPQIYQLNVSSTFTNIADSNCPACSYLTVVNSFLVLAGLTANPYRIYWSGLNDVSSSSAFTPGVNSCDFQDLADGGVVRGVSGGEYGVIFQDSTIRRLLYSPGSVFVFQIDRIAVDDGLLYPYSLVRGGNNIFWFSPLGFKMLPPGGVPTPIGKERVDRTFVADFDSANPQLMQGANDPTETKVIFAYKSKAGPANTMDKALCYDWALDRWSLLSGGGYAGAQAVASFAPPTTTLEGVDAVYGTGTVVQVTSFTTLGVFTANQPTQFTVGMGVQITTTSSSTSAGPTKTPPSPFVATQPYYITAANLTTSTFSLSTGGGIGVNSSTGTAGLVLPSTAATYVLSYAIESIDSLNLGSLDNILNTSQIDLGAVNTANQAGFYTGSNLQATLETPEQGGDGQRLFNAGFRVVSDATTGTLYGSASYRENPQAAYNYTAENTSNAQGYVPLRISTRYSRNKVRIPAATNWSYAAGVEPNNSPDGER